MAIEAAYLFLNHVYRLYQVLKPLESKETLGTDDIKEHTTEQEL